MPPSSTRLAYRGFGMRHRIVTSTVIVASVIWAGVPSGPAAAATPFRDIGSSPFAADIQWAFDNDITAGCATTRFCPRSVVTREQMASFLDRMFDLPATSRNFFSDDNVSHHQAAINRVAAAGITSGCQAGRYCPGSSVTREQMASFLARAAKLTIGSGRDYFTDDNGSEHESNIERVAAAGISAGCGSLRFCPTATVTREQMAAFLHRVVDPVSPPTGGRSTTLVGAGDIAVCSSTGDEATAKLLDGIPGTVFTAGDNVYSDGTAAEFSKCYAPSWGRHRARTRPAPGNHDYHVAGAAGYFGYFGTVAGPSGRGYYAYDIGGWRVYSLNSEVVSTAQVDWLRNDLAANASRCVAAYWHHPRFATPDDNGSHGPQEEVEPLWDALADSGAELVLNGHSHHYERFAANRGITEVIVGTGGTGLNGFDNDIATGSVVRNGTTHGVLELTLSANGFAGRFVPVAGKTFTDTFGGTCH